MRTGKPNKIFSEAQEAEEALLFKRRVKVALTKAYKQFYFVRDELTEDDRRKLLAKPLNHGKDRLEMVICILAMEWAKTKWVKK